MDIIEIDSSEGEDDAGIGHVESQDKSLNDGAVDQFPGGPNHDSYQKKHGIEADPIFTDKWGVDANSASHYMQKRTLPLSLRPAILKTTSNPYLGSHGRPVLVPQYGELVQAGQDNGSKVDLNDISMDRHQPGAESLQQMQKRSLPFSLQPRVNKTAPEGSHDSVGASAADRNIYVEGDADGKADEFHTHENNDKHRNLPFSLLNGKSLIQPRANVEKWVGNQALNYHAESSHSIVESSADGVRRLPPSFRNEILDTRPKANASGRDDVQKYQNSGTSRVLHSSLMYGKFGSISQPADANDAGYRSVIGEERHVEHDERVIYREALQNLGQLKLEEDLPEGFMTVPLLKHQKIALAWMVQKERSVHCAGGILADDQGLGKTISMIALILKQMALQAKFTSDSSRHIETEALNLDEDDDGVSQVNKEKQSGKDDPLKKPVASTSMHASHNDGVSQVNKEKQSGKDDPWKKPVASTSMHASHNRRPAAGTLVVCPASVLRQWARELDEKVTNSAKLSVLVYHGGTRTKEPGDLAKYDVVLTTYSIVTNELPKQSHVDEDDEEQKNLGRYGLSSDFSASKKRKQASISGKRTKKKGKGVKDSSFDYDSGALARVRWFRVILDEAQTIKNHRTQVARACCGLRAKRRWCLSGTPIQNTIDDLYSYFRFLKYDPYAAYSSFCSSIKYPISRDAIHGYKKLQAVLRTVLLRRTKDTLINGEPIVILPPKLVNLKTVDFSEEERAFYLKLEADSRKQFKAYAAAGTVKQNYASILLMLLRLRQACDHPFLVKGYHSDTVGKDSLAMAKQLPREMLSNLLNQLEASLAICGICNDPPEDAVVAMCGHVFCYQCISERLTSDDNLCPIGRCKDILGTDSVFSRATLTSCISEEVDHNAATSSSYDEECSIDQSNYMSSKIRAALEILNSICCQNANVESGECNECACYRGRDCDHISKGAYSDENAESHTREHLKWNPKMPIKAIVFSQWTSMLDLLEIALNRSLIQYRRLDGSMSLASRDRAVKDFNNDPEVTVMLMSLKAGNLGLNMVAACHVILLDLWWNPTTEDQAVDRAHRIGQTRPVTVSRLTIKDTVEDRILQLQEEKRKMVSSAFGEDQSGGHTTRLTVDDLRYLFMV